MTNDASLASVPGKIEIGGNGWTFYTGRFSQTTGGITEQNIGKIFNRTPAGVSATGYQGIFSRGAVVTAKSGYEVLVCT